MEVSALAAAIVSDGTSTEAMSPPLALEEAPWSHAATNGTQAAKSVVFQFNQELAFIIPKHFPPPMRAILMSLRCCSPLPSM